jgi:DNA-binding NarL/FixJ family response regulator
MPQHPTESVLSISAPHQSADPTHRKPLTSREQQVLELVAQGLANRTIARSLAISESTVKNHLRSVYAKLGVTHRTQAAVLAVRTGLA